MNLFSQIRSFQLLIFCMNDQEFVANLDVFFYYFFCNLIKVNQFLYCFIIFLYLISSFSLTRSLLVLYAYVSIESIDCILLLSFERKIIVLISPVKTLYVSLINLCRVFNINLSAFMTSLWSFLRLFMLISFFPRKLVFLSR